MLYKAGTLLCTGLSVALALRAGLLNVGAEGQLAAGSTRLYADYQALTDRQLLTLVLRHTGGNLSRAASTLGITRATLRSKLAALGIPVERPTTGPN